MKLSLVLALASGCLSATMPPAVTGGMTMTPQIVQAAGTHAFSAPYDRVFAAVANALQSEGFPIAISNSSEGMIKTGQKLIRTEAVSAADYRGNGYGTMTTAEITRQYVIRIHASGDTTVVIAEPRIFEGNAELSGQPIWDLDGPEGERNLWQRLFRDISEAL